MRIHAKRALLGQDWAHDVVIVVDGGTIAEINHNETTADTHVDTLLPAPSNLHSHTFQRAMAGMTEYRSAGRDSFWTWRELMYRFLDHLTPDQVEAIAALAFIEMQEAGFAAVGEFHYIHHQPGGAPYTQLTELSDRIFAAAATTGIGLTHLPVLYTYGGVNQEPLAGGQLRFSNDVDRFLDLREACRTAMADLPDDTHLGTAPHSLRATSPDDLARLLTASPDGPLHIHAAEQTQEIADVEAKLGQRPIEWLLKNAGVDDRWCLIHATHMTEAETIGLAQSGAVAGLCPITESNLGDGIFNGPTYLEHGGALGVGSDSNIRITLKDELRTMEYSQRLRDRARNVMTTANGHVGQTLFTTAAHGAAKALDRDAGDIATGKLADLMAINSAHPTLCALSDAQLLDGLCFAAPDGVVTDTWSAGRHMVQKGQHIYRDSVVSTYRNQIKKLLEAL